MPRPELTRRCALRVRDRGLHVIRDGLAHGYEGAMNADRLIGFLGGLIEDAERKTFLIVDNLRVHHAVPVREWLEQEPYFRARRMCRRRRRIVRG